MRVQPREGVVGSLGTGSLGGAELAELALKTEWDVFREVVTQTLIPGLTTSTITT